MEIRYLDKERKIAHLDLDTFFVSVERLFDSRLCGKPLMIGGAGDRGVVAACSYEARRFGVHSAMPVKLARRLCPEGIFIRGDFERYGKYSDMVTDIVSETVPVYEKSSIDEFYIDLSGTDKYLGSLKLMSLLKQRIANESGLPVSFGLSENKTVSKVATGEAKPNGEKMIPYGFEKSFLSPLSIKKIPMVGEKTYYMLRSMGVEKVHTLQQMPPELLESAMGKNGIVLWQKANGIDLCPVVPYNEQKSVSAEQTFEQDSIDISTIKACLVSMTEKIGFKLRTQNRLTACITVKIRYSDFDTHTMQNNIGYTAADHVLIPKVQELFTKLHTRRMAIRLVGVRCSKLVRGNIQISLFDDTSEEISLYQAIDRINRKYGTLCVHRASGK
jgi:DNA polymerase-4